MRMVGERIFMMGEQCEWWESNANVGRANIHDGRAIRMTGEQDGWYKN